MNRNLRKERIGVVTSNKMDKSIVVSIARRVKHDLYGKFLNKTSKFPPLLTSVSETAIPLHHENSREIFSNQVRTRFSFKIRNFG